MRESFVDAQENTTDRYLELCDVWRKKYLEMDRQELKERFHLEGGQDAHFITYFSQRYRLDQRTGMLTLEADAMMPEAGVRMLEAGVMMPEADAMMSEAGVKMPEADVDMG